VIVEETSTRYCNRLLTLGCDHVVLERVASPFRTSISKGDVRVVPPQTKLR
jgi:hypothetical protein